MTLGELIAALDEQPQEMGVRFANGERPGRFISYRGAYADLALESGEGYDGNLPAHMVERGYVAHETVGSLRAAADETIGKTLEGYKGGEYIMYVNTPIWLAEEGVSSGVALVGVEQVPGKPGVSSPFVCLKGHDISEYV
jgi:hypothetical protein